VNAYNIGYRHENGEVEGFVGHSFTSATVAREDAIRQIRRKCEDIGQAYDAGRLIETDRGVSAAEKKRLRQDWWADFKQS
jgi:hypothetical protein